MEEKKNVTITIENDDMTKRLSADTAIVMTVENLLDIVTRKTDEVKGCTMYVGRGIPHVIFNDIFSHLVCDIMIQKCKDVDKANKAQTGFALYELAKKIEDESHKIKKTITDEEADAAIKDAFMDLLKEILK